MNDREEWRQIEEAPKYFISSSGRVQLTEGRQVKDGPRELSVHMHDGHPTVNLFIDGTYVKRRIDHLMAKTFYGQEIESRPRGRPKQRKWVIDRETGEPTEI